LSDNAIDQMLDQLMATEWVVYAKPCLGRPDTVVAYLSRYSHRTALSDRRLIGIRDDKVGLRYHDYRDDKDKSMWLDGQELLRRFLTHVLPKGLMRIRHYGFLANRCCRQRLTQIREALQRQTEQEADRAKAKATTLTKSWTPTAWTPVCPQCRRGVLHLLRIPAAARLDGG
jgi:hypothetical protein